MSIFLECSTLFLSNRNSEKICGTIHEGKTDQCITKILQFKIRMFQNALPGNPGWILALKKKKLLCGFFCLYLFFVKLDDTVLRSDESKKNKTKIVTYSYIICVFHIVLLSFKCTQTCD